MTSHRISGMTVCLAASSISHFDDTWHVGACPIPMRYGAQFEAANCCGSTARVGDCKWQKLNIVLNQIMAISLGMPLRLRRHPPKNETLRLRPKPRACRERIRHDRYLEPAPIQWFWMILEKSNETQDCIRPNVIPTSQTSQAETKSSQWHHLLLCSHCGNCLGRKPHEVRHLVIETLDFRDHQHCGQDSDTPTNQKCTPQLHGANPPIHWYERKDAFPSKILSKTSRSSFSSFISWNIMLPRCFCCRSTTAANRTHLEQLGATNDRAKKRPASVSTFYTCYFKLSNHVPKQSGILLHIELNPLRCNESFLLQQSKLMKSLAVRSYPSRISPSF